MSSHAIVLDANILVRALLGRRVFDIIQTNKSSAQFFTPDIAFADAFTYLPPLLKKRGADIEAGMRLLDGLRRIVQILSIDVYGCKQQEAMLRIGGRDPDDWPVLACAMLLGCPFWTEDRDLFGAGVPTWTSDRVNLYFSE